MSDEYRNIQKYCRSGYVEGPPGKKRERGRCKTNDPRKSQRPTNQVLRVTGHDWNHVCRPQNDLTSDVTPGTSTGHGWTPVCRPQSDLTPDVTTGVTTTGTEEE